MPLLTCLKDTHVTVFSEHRVEYNCYHYTEKEGIVCISATFKVKPHLELILAEKELPLPRDNLSSVCLHLLRGLLLTGMTKASQL